MIADNRHYEKVGSEVKDITDDLPFEIPDNWVWTRLGKLITIISGVSYDKKDVSNKGIRILRGGNVNDLKISIFPDDVFLPEKYYDIDKQVRKNDVVIVASTGSKAVIGKAGFVDNDIFNTQIGAFLRIVRPIFDVIAPYLKMIFATEYYREHIRTQSQGTNINNVKAEYITDLRIPLPPLAEQARIVTEIEKFEPLIAEYDKLEQQATKLDDEIYDKLKKSILQYAIQGKLVPQDPNDEPASVLLERIRAEKKAKLGKKYVDSYIYKGDDNCYYEHIAGREQDELVEGPFDIPENWAWAKLLDLGCFSSGKTPDMSEPAYWQNGNVQWFTSKDMKTKYLTESQLKITELAANDMTLYPANTLLWVVRSGILKSSLPICILKQPATINQDIKAYQLYQSSMIDYVYYMLKGMEARILDNYVKRITTVHSLKFDELISKLAVPIPPLAEQNRIVAKINEMFAML